MFADGLSPPVNVTITAVKANSALVSWDIAEGDPVIGFAITQQVSHAHAGSTSPLAHVRCHAVSVRPLPSTVGVHHGSRLTCWTRLH